MLERLGVDVSLSPERVGACVAAVGIGFAYAPASHGALRHAGPVRRALGVPTLFNLLGPLANPAGAGHQLLGAASDANADRLAAALHALGTRRSLVVCGNGELDEVSTWGETTVREVTPAGVTRHTWTAATFGVGPGDRDDPALKATGPDDSAATIRRVLAAEIGPAADLVVVNAAAGLLAAGAETDPPAAADLARAALTDGAARETLERLSAFTRESVTPG